VADQTTSSSGQFIIHGADHDQRAMLAMAADELREEFVALIDRAEAQPDPAVPLHEPEGDAQPIHLQIQPGSESHPRPRITQVEGTRQLTFSLTIDGAAVVRRDAFREEILRLLLAERILRSHPEVEFTGRSEWLPPWLFTGVAGALDHLQHSHPSARFAAIFQSGRIMNVEDILDARPEKLDAISREVFAASACGLVLMLIEQPQGAVRFRQFLASIPVSTESFHVQLVRRFPGLALSRNSLEKWWAIQLASLAQPGVLECFGAAETERRLADALMVRRLAAEDAKQNTGGFAGIFSGLLAKRKQASAAAPAPAASEKGTAVTGDTATSPPDDMVPITDIKAVLGIPEREKVLQRNQSWLAELNLRAFPLHRPVIEGYQQVLGLLIKGRTKGVAERLAKLTIQRKSIIETMTQAEDYLDWYEATQRTTPSGTFDLYFQRLDEFESRRPKRDDPISRYLDEIEREYE
jgi:hypothetical protein